MNSAESEERAWDNKWAAQDFSWNGLTSKSPISGLGGNNLQESIRRLHGNRPDDELQTEGLLVGGTHGKLFHVAYVPDAWAKSKEIDLPVSRLAQLKNEFWQSLFGRQIRETFEGELAGFRLTETASERLLKASRASFSWTSLEGKLHPSVSHSDRRFADCLFNNQVELKGKYKKPELPEYRFERCVFRFGVSIAKFDGLGKLSVLDCFMDSDFHVHEANLGDVIISGIRSQRIAISETETSGMSIESCHVSHVDLAHVNIRSDFVLRKTEAQETIALWSCNFRRRATFADVGWPSPGLEKAVANDCKFWGITEITGTKPPPIQFFDQAYFKEGVSLQSFSERQWWDAFEEAARSTDAAPWKEFSLQEQVASVEASCRSLRKMAESDGNIHVEHLWRAAEIKVRRKRSDCQELERVFSWAYGLFADYGLAIGRPFISLAIIVGIFSAFYGWLGGEAWLSSRIDWDSLYEGLGYSLNRTIPIGVFADEDNVWRNELIGSGGDISGIAMRTIATIQTIMSAVLIYLGVMAVRRKFRLS